MTTVDNTTEMAVQTIAVPLSVGSRVTLLEDVDIDSDEGVRAKPTFEDYVEQYAPETGLLKFENSDVGRVEFITMMHEADGVEIIEESQT